MNEISQISQISQAEQVSRAAEQAAAAATGGAQGDQMAQAFILLLAGFCVVFVVLILLIIAVSLYSKIITAIFGTEPKKKKKAKVVVKEEVPEPQTAVQEVPEDEGIPPEIIAVIAAAVDSLYGERPHRVRSVRRSRSGRSAWSKAGAAENTRPF